MPSEYILKSLTPYLKPTATLKVNGWTSKLVGVSAGLKDVYQASILLKLMDETCSYLMALIFFYADRIMISFLVGITQTSIIFLVNKRELRTLWMGDLRVYTRVS